MWGWLKAILAAFFGELFGVAAKEIRTELEKPKTVENANTPQELKDSVDNDVRDQLARMQREASRGRDK